MLETSSLSESYLEHLIVHDVIDTESALLVLDEQRRQTPPLGRLAMLKQYLNMKQIFEVLRLQTDSGLRFGEQAITLGYMTNEQLEELLALQQSAKPGVSGILFELGLAKKGVLQKKRREFLRELESMLT